jgi:hypothetical protein
MPSSFSQLIIEGTLEGYPRDFEVTPLNKMAKLPFVSIKDVPIRLIPCDQLQSPKTNEKTAVHFYKNDEKFSSTVLNPLKWVHRLQEYDAVFTPDFTVGVQMGLGQRIQNTYFSRQIGAVWSSRGLTVIPSLRWTGPADYEFVMEGIPIGTVFAVSAHGSFKDPVKRSIFEAGLKHIISDLEPAGVIVYGKIAPAFREEMQHLTNIYLFPSSGWPPPVASPVSASAGCYPLF